MGFQLKSGGFLAEIRWLGSAGGGAVQVAGQGQCRLRSVQVEGAVAGDKGAGFRWLVQVVQVQVEELQRSCWPKGAGS